MAERQTGVLLLLTLQLFQYEVPSLLGYELLPLALAHLLSHLYPLCLRIVNLCGHEGLSLRLLDNLDSQLTGGSYFDWLLRRSGHGITAGVDILHTAIPWRLLLFLFLMAEKGHLGVALNRLSPVEFVHLVVGPRNDLSGLRAASSIAGGGAFQNGRLHESGTAGGGQIC